MQCVSYNYHSAKIYLPSYLVHLINGTDISYDKCGKTVLAMAGLAPLLIVESNVSIKDILNMYCDDLPIPKKH